MTLSVSGIGERNDESQPSFALAIDPVRHGRSRIPGDYGTADRPNILWQAVLSLRSSDQRSRFTWHAGKIRLA
jgi:hypothetical protein